MSFHVCKVGLTRGGVGPTLHTWMDIQTDGDYIKRVVYGPSGDHTLKNENLISENSKCLH